MEEVKYKFTAIGRTGSREVFPQNGNTLAVSWEKEEENAFFRKKLKGKMLFTGDDFHWLFTFEDSQYRCDPIGFIVEKQCTDGYSQFFVARLILNNADWDKDQCTVNIEAEVEDRYTCYNDFKDKEYNLLSLVFNRKTVKLVQGTLEYQNCFGNDTDPKWCGAGDQNDGWVVLRFYQRNPNPDFPDPDPHDETFDITWVREVITSDNPLGAPWIDIGGGQYAKQPALYGYRSFGGQYDTGYEYKVGGTIDNGMLLLDCIREMFNQGCYPMKIKSKFFNWNPDPEINKNIFNERLSSVGYDLNSSGYLVANVNPFHKVTDYMAVLPNTELWLNNASIVGGDGNNWFYDENKNPVSLMPEVPGGLYVKLADILSNVRYVRLQYFDDTFPGAVHGSDLMFYMGTGEIPFQPYDYNNYVTGLPSKVANLVLFQKSDVKRPDGSGNATVSNITLSQLIKDICNTFNCKWDIDEDGAFIIEHVSFFQKGVGLNLIGRSDSRLRAGMMGKYGYDIDNMPRREIFQMMDDKYGYGDFKGVPIIYSNSCVGQGEKEDKDWIVENIMTDVSLALNNSASDSQIVSDDGFVLIACDEAYNILSEGVIMSGNTLNNPLSWAHLHYDYWRHERVFNRFSMNNVQTDALSVVPTKKQVKIPVSLCCDQIFDPEELVNTELGEGQVGEAQFDLYKELLTLTLLYSAEALVSNEAPVAVNDEAITWVGLTIDIDVLANDTDADGTINPGTLTIVFGGSHGTSSVVGGKIRYVPTPGYVGADTITYNVKDNWAEQSNNANVAITVKPGSPLPIANNDSYSTGENVVITVGNILSNDTGDGAIECIPETKATVSGGTIQIFANGAFIYTPPTDYVGSDDFDYTMKDSNNNTDIGHVTITVFEKETVYVRYSEVNLRHVNMEMGCEGEEGGSNEVVGNQDIVDQIYAYYSDAAGTIPLNVNGYGILLKIRKTRTGTGAGIATFDIPATGLNNEFDDVLVSETYYGCPAGGGSDDTAFDDFYELLTSPDYTILFL